MAIILVVCGISWWRGSNNPFRRTQAILWFLVAGANVLQILDLLNVIDIW